MLHTKHQGSRSWGFRQEYFQSFILKIYFSLCDLDMQQTRTIWTILKEGHISFISTKIGQNPSSSLGDVLKSNCWRHTTDDTQRTSNNHNSSPWANVSGELKIWVIPKNQCGKSKGQVFFYFNNRNHFLIAKLLKQSFFLKSALLMINTTLA